MRRILQGAFVALALLGLAAGTAFAQKTEAPKDTKKTEAPKKADAPKADAKKTDAAMPAAAPMDINTASEKELASLKGIGEVRAKAIVKGRPYKGKDDLVTKKIIPKSVYDDIKDQIIAKQDMAKEAPKDTKKK